MSRIVIIDDTDASIVYGGGKWTPLTSAVSGANPEYMNTAHETHDLGATITYTFTGSQIKAYCTLNAPSIHHIPGSTYSIDSGEPVRFNATGDVSNSIATSGSVISHIPFFTSPELSEGQHTITISIDRVASNGPFFYFDFFTVTTSNWQSAPNVIVDDGDTNNIKWGPSWIIEGGEREYLHTSRQSPGAVNGTAAFTFQGTSISAFGTLNGRYGDAPFIAFALDDRPVALFSAPSTTSLSYNQQLYHVDGLADNVEHKLTMTAIVKQGVPAWFFDYLIFTPSSTPTIGSGTGPVANAPGTAATGRPTTPGSGSATPTGSNSASVIVTTMNGTTVTLTNDTQQAGASTGPSQQGQGGESSAFPKGAVIGGVVGGVTVLLLIVFFLLWRRRKRRLEQLMWRDEKYLDGSTTNFLPLGALSSSANNSNQPSAEFHPAGELVYRVAPAPQKGRLLRPDIGPYQPQTTPGSSPLENRPSLPALSQSSGTDFTSNPSESVEPQSPPAPQRVETLLVVQQTEVANKSPPPTASVHPITTAVSTGPIQEVDGGIRLDAWDMDEPLPDTLPPTYARYR